MYCNSVAGVLLAILGCAFAHTYHLGACPVVEPMPGFEMNKVCIDTVLCLTARHAIHWQFNISADTLGIWAVQSV
jgi:hypothetical protein